MTESVLARAKAPLFNSHDAVKLMLSIQSDLAALGAQFNQLRTDFNNHTHGGVTTGAGTTAAATTTATAVTINTQP
jgi:hypothetical protein